MALSVWFKNQWEIFNSYLVLACPGWVQNKYEKIKYCIISNL
jgi:hypothetical protein